MRVGCSLPLDYLCGRDDTREARPWRQAFGAAPAALRHLGGLGVAAVELRQAGADTPAGRVLEAAGTVLAAGMGVTVHAWLADPAAGEEPERSYPWLEPLAAGTAAAGGLLVVVHAFHAPAPAPAPVLEELEERTVEALRRIAGYLERRRLPARFALELNRDKGRADPGATFRGAARMWRRVGRPGVGICWDWGHGLANALGGRDAAEPGADFLEGVAHVHAHGLGPAGGTHWPLARGRVPAGRWLALLSAAGFGGILDLELSPWKFLAAEQEGGPAGGAALRAALAGSVAVLRG